MSTRQREHWGSKLGFFLAAAGSAVGLGTLWKFPYVIGKNGGGLFVLIYLLSTLFIGVPLFISEVLLGRKSQRGAVGVFIALSPKTGFWKVAGWLGVTSSFLIMSFYSVVAGWGVSYVLMSLNHFYEGKSVSEISEIFELLARSGDITIFWHAVFTALTVVLVLPGIRHGIEYWTKIMTSALFLLILVLMSYSITLDGFGQAVHFLFSPNYEGFTFSHALEAVGLSFFNLSLGQGIMLTYGSYMSKEEDVPKTALLIAFTILIVAMMAGLMLFPIIFTFDMPLHAAGYGIIFKTLPFLFAKLPAPLLFSTLFFILFVFAALTSSVALVEAVAANLIDLYGCSRKQAVTIVGVGCFLLGIPSALAGSGGLFGNWGAIYGKDFLTTVDELASVWLLPIGELILAIFVGWSLKREMLRKEFCSGTRFARSFPLWYFFMRYVVPVSILIVILQSSGLIEIKDLFRVS